MGIAPGPAGQGQTRAVAPVVWFTGLPGAGKTTLASRLAARIRATGRAAEELDGDAIRALFPGTGFSRPEREAHVRRVGWTASLLAAHGVWAVVSLVSPDRAARDFARSLSPWFAEIHVSTPREECERRDPRGLYARARRGDVRHLAGVDAPYEAPASPELVVDTRWIGVDDAVDWVLWRVMVAGGGA